MTSTPYNHATVATTVARPRRNVGRNPSPCESCSARKIRVRILRQTGFSSFLTHSPRMQCVWIRSPISGGTPLCVECHKKHLNECGPYTIAARTRKGKVNLPSATNSPRLQYHPQPASHSHIALEAQPSMQLHDVGPPVASFASEGVAQVGDQVLPTWPTAVCANMSFAPMPSQQSWDDSSALQAWSYMQWPPPNNTQSVWGPNGMAFTSNMQPMPDGGFAGFTNTNGLLGTTAGAIQSSTEEFLTGPYYPGNIDLVQRLWLSGIAGQRD